jgi:hypothetical protein
LFFRGDGNIKKEWVNKNVNPDQIVSSYYVALLRKRNNNSNFFHLILPVFINKSGRGKCLIQLQNPYKSQNSKKRKPVNKLDLHSLAADYQNQIDRGMVRNRADLARKLNVSRAWITKAMKYLKY